MGVWKFFLAQSTDLEVTSDVTGQARNKQLTVAFNRSGNLTFQLPLTLDNLEYTKTHSCCILAQKNNTVVWSGPVWTRTIDFGGEKIDISAVGWFEYLMTRYLWEGTIPDYSVAGEGDMTIASGLLTIANSDSPTYITFGGMTGAEETRKVKYEIWQSIGEEIINLSDTEHGFDIYMDPLTRELSLKAPETYTHQTDIPFGYNFGADNISNLIIEDNGGEMRNRIQVVGKDNNVWQYDADGTGGSPDSQGINGLMTEVIQATESDDALLLQAIANAQGALKENGMINYEITLKAQGANNPYELFEDYDLGDRIDVTAQKRIDNETIIMEMSPRVFGATIDIDDQGVERVSSLQTTFAGV